MEKFQFLGFEPTPTEKYLGILTVRVIGAVVIILRYKIVPKKDGSACFPTCASYKMSGRSQGEEYEECFLLDSRSDNEAMIKFIMHHFHSWQKSQQTTVTNTISTPFIKRPEYQAQQEFPGMPADLSPIDYSNMPF